MDLLFVASILVFHITKPIHVCIYSLVQYFSFLSLSSRTLRRVSLFSTICAFNCS
jgi:hypothetical protein